MKAHRPWLFFIFLCCISLLTAIWLRGGTDARPLAALQSIAHDIGSRFTELGRGSSDVPVTPPPLPYSADQPGFPTFTQFNHTDNDSQACGRPRTQSRSDTNTKLIYKWVNADGQTHMADKRPDGHIASVMDIGMTKRNFTYEIIPDGVSVPIDFPGQLSAGSKRIYDTWHFFLGESKLRQSRIKLKLIGGTDRFNAAYAKVSRNNKPVSGFYSIATNMAVVKFHPASLERTQATAFHETSHLITASHLGPTTSWLTEGLAEYFENMQVNGQTGAIHPNKAHIVLLQQSPLPDLKAYFSMDRAEWYGKDRSRSYAVAWSLVYFLMSGSPGMYALQETVQQAEINFCKPFSAMEALNSAYPGGLSQLEADWRKWLSVGDFQVQQT